MKSLLTRKALIAVTTVAIVSFAGTAQADDSGYHSNEFHSQHANGLVSDSHTAAGLVTVSRRGLRGSRGYRSSRGFRGRGYKGRRNFSRYGRRSYSRYGYNYGYNSSYRSYGRYNRGYGY